MTIPILATKLYIPPIRPKLVSRPHLIRRLNEGLHRKLTFISAPAGFGKTTLVSEWIRDCEQSVAWLSLGEGDNDLTRFLTYLIRALQTIKGDIGENVLAVLQSPQPPVPEMILTSLINEISTIKTQFIFVLDDYHLIKTKTIDEALTFLLDHLDPSKVHMVISTREDPNLPLARLRVRDQLTELRIADLRFSLSETTAFLNQVMGLNLLEEDIHALEMRTEGWIAGLQLAALSMQGHEDKTRFIKTFTGSHHFVLDYLLEEVLQQQTERVQTFLLRTSILDRLCASLCEAVLFNDSTNAQETLEYIAQSNLFIVSLDDERRWYRYHHLFADLLRQRLQENMGDAGLEALHIQASIWYEDKGMEFEAFHHATAAHDIERAARLVEGKGMPLHFRRGIAPVLNWLESLPGDVLDAKPKLWVMYASVLSMIGQNKNSEQKLQAAESALKDLEVNDKTQNLIGHIAAIRAVLAVAENDVETIIAQSQRALAYLDLDNVPVRTATIWKLGIAYQLQGKRAEAGKAYAEAMTISEASGNIITHLAATVGLGAIQALDNQLHSAADLYRHVLQVVGDAKRPAAWEPQLGLARIFYEWNDLQSAEKHGQESLQLAGLIIENKGKSIRSEIFLAQLKLAQGKVVEASTILANASQSAHQHHFVHQIADIAAAQVLVLLHKGELEEASYLAQKHELPLSQARVYLAQKNPSLTLAILEPLRQEMETKDWKKEQVEVMVLQALALRKLDEKQEALQVLSDVLMLTASEGFVRSFLDEGIAMAQLLSEVAAQGMMPDYTAKLLQAFEVEGFIDHLSLFQPLVEPLSERELEVLRLIAEGLSNREISDQLFIALDTIKGHNRRIYGKLQVQRRTEAVARARELGLLNV